MASGEKSIREEIEALDRNEFHYPTHDKWKALALRLAEQVERLEAVYQSAEASAKRNGEEREELRGLLHLCQTRRAEMVEELVRERDEARRERDEAMLEPPRACDRCGIKVVPLALICAACEGKP